MAEPRTVRRWSGLAILLLVWLCLVGPSLARAASFQVRADPDRLPADGTSQAVIVAEVMGPSGLPVPDGTVVRFMTTLGKIVSPVQTVGGLAQTSLTASRTAGTAVISVIAGADRQVLEVEFQALPGSAAPGERTVELTGDDVAYSAEHCLFVATDKVKLTAGRVTLTADGLQYAVPANEVRAQGNVVLKVGDKEVRADALCYDLLALRGRLIRVTDDGGEHLTVEGDPPVTRPDEAKDPALWGPAKTDDTRAWVKAKRALIDPGEKIILDHATFYVDDMKVLSLRRHVVPPRPTTAVLGNVLGFSTVGGISLDYPYYYRASQHDVGALYLRRNSALGSQLRPGWLLGLSEEYSREGKLDGSLTFDDVLHPSYGYQWQHQQRVGRLSLHADFDSVSLDNGLPSYRTANLSAQHPFGSGSMALTLGKSNYGDSREQYVDLGYRFGAFRIANGITGTPSLHFRESDREVVSHEVVIDPATGEPILFDTADGGRSSALGLDMGVSLRPREFARMTFAGTLSTGYTQALPGGSGRLNVTSRWTLERRFDRLNYVGLTLNLGTGTSVLQRGLLTAGGRQSIGLTARGKIKDAVVGLRFTQGLDGSRRYGSFDLEKPLPFGKDMIGQPLWTFSANHMFSQFGTFQAQNTVLSLNRIFGRYRASLNYSPQGGGSYLSNRPSFSPLGFGYTYSGGKNIWLEFSAAAE